MVLKLVIIAVLLLVFVISIAQVIGVRKREKRKAEVAEIMRQHREQTKNLANSTATEMPREMVIIPRQKPVPDKPKTDDVKESYLEKTGPRYVDYLDRDKIATVDTLQKSTPSIFKTDVIGEYYKKHPVEPRLPPILPSDERVNDSGSRSSLSNIGDFYAYLKKQRPKIKVKSENNRIHSPVPKISGETYQIDYCDALGEATSRTITVHEVEKRGKSIYLEAFCHLRNEMRTFVIDRIVGDMVNVSTGKSVTPIEIYSPPKEWASVDKDAWEEFHSEVDDILPLRAIISFDYIDIEGNRTTRTVDIKQFGHTSYGGKFYGHCRLRDANRVFRTNHVKHCVDLETGEVVDDILRYFEEKYRASSEYSLDKLFESEFEALGILLFVAKADGSVRAAELSKVAAFCQKLSGDRRINEKQIKETFKSMTVPSPNAFIKYVDAQAKKDEVFKRSLADTAQAIVDTQKTVHPVEKFALDYIYSKLT
ncbi:WYL domain-containing protein [Methylomonas sp. HYX-M1]|uniref:WYL domain-containing protein n=1 Tax=Methylomonas sp. HYX-M1 TaxID=3139307 RepID=UPI00345C5716